MNKSDAVLVLGAYGLVGSAIVRQLEKLGYSNVLAPTRKNLNLLSQAETLSYFQVYQPKHVFMAAAKVGGISANNTYRADFIYENLTIQNNVFHSCFVCGVEKLLFLGSSCIYPKNCPQPIKEEYLLSGPLEATNEPYAIAKIAGLKMAESFRRQYGCNYFSLMPTNLYGINDNYHPENSHVIPGLIARMKVAMDAGEDAFVVWGTGQPRREFLYVDDLALACLFVMEYSGEVPDLLNVGFGEDVSIAEIAHLIKECLGFRGEIIFDSSRPDGTMRKLMDSSRINEMGWRPQVSLESGLKMAVDHYLSIYKNH